MPVMAKAEGNATSEVKCAWRRVSCVLPVAIMSYCAEVRGAERVLGHWGRLSLHADTRLYETARGYCIVLFKFDTERGRTLKKLKIAAVEEEEEEEEDDRNH
jgi:hypothetical protein